MVPSTTVDSHEERDMAGGAAEAAPTTTIIIAEAKMPTQTVFLTMVCTVGPPTHAG
jgi:hypothetical protein